MNRLFIDELTSIGVVQEGDNPDAEILFYKTRAERPSTEDAIAAHLERLDRGIAETRAGNELIRATIQRIQDERPEMPTETIDDVIARIDAIADAMMKADKTLTQAAAKAAAWKENPDLVAKSRNAPHRSVQADQTISDRIRYIIDDATRRSSWRPLLEQWGSPHTRDEIIRKVRTEVWRSPDGQSLKELDRALGRNPYTAASISSVRKSREGQRFSKALELLESGIPLHQYSAPVV